MKPKKQKFNIATNSGPKEVEGEWVKKLPLDIKAFVYREPDKFWIVTEFKSGMAICWPMRTKKLAIDEAEKNLTNAKSDWILNRIKYSPTVNEEE